MSLGGIAQAWMKSNLNFHSSEIKHGKKNCSLVLSIPVAQAHSMFLHRVNRCLYT